MMISLLQENVSKNESMCDVNNVIAKLQNVLIAPRTVSFYFAQRRDNLYDKTHRSQTEVSDE